MYFPVAGIEVSPFVPPLVAFVVSFFASMGGISGAFLLLPFQVSFLGYTNPSVSATNQFYNIVAIPSGVYKYIKEKRMVWPLTLAVAVGTLPGVFIGALARVMWLPDPKQFKLFAGLVLFYIGGRMVWGLIKESMAKKQVSSSATTANSTTPLGATATNSSSATSAGVTAASNAAANNSTNGSSSASTLSGATSSTVSNAATASTQEAASSGFVQVQEFSLKRIAYTFKGQEYSCPTMGVFLLSFVVGIVGGTYGIGGGAIIAPFFVSWFRLPIHTLSGATLMGTFLTSIAAVVFFMLIAPYFPEQAVKPDWMLGLLFGVGGFAGMYCGASMQKHVPALLIKWMLGIVITGTALKYFLEYFA